MSKSHEQQIDYVEFNVKDIQRARDFYGKAFGWTFTDYGPEYCEFNDGRLTGGLTTTAPVRSGGGPLVILYADDLPETVRRVEQAGGKIVKPIYSFPGGHRFHFEDPDGYELAVYSTAGSEE
jgi:predicted enzyme related to lactoylglutathione lyase